MIEILPAILAETPEQFRQMLEKVSSFASVLHFDASDGIFTKTKFVGPEVIATAPANIKWDIHLMIQNPETVLTAWLTLPHISRITFHIEATDKTQEIIDNIHGVGKLVGISIKPETPTETIEPFVNKIDSVQFMSVHPGQYGAKFLPEVLDKISAFHAKYPDTKISIDGGVSPGRIPAMVKAGVSIFISGGYIINSEDPEKAISELKKAAE